MAATEQELLTFVHALFEAVNEQRSFSRYREHVQKLNVSAGDHCLYTEPVEGGRRQTVTSICSLASCSGVDLVTLARGFMHNIFEVKTVLEPGQDETTCQEGLWILGPGEYMQACFEGVPEGCDLHLYANGSYKQAISFLFGLPLMITAPEEEVAPAEGIIWSHDAGTQKLYKHDASDGTILQEFEFYSNTLTGLTHDGTYLWACDRVLDIVIKIDPSDGSILDSFSLPTSNPQGIVHDGTYIWVCSEDPDWIYKYDPDGTLLNTYANPVAESSGITDDGTNLILCSSYYPAELYKVRKTDCALIGTEVGPYNNPRCLTYDAAYIWVGAVPTGKICKWDRSTDTILKEFNAPAGSLNGLAWSAQ